MNEMKAFYKKLLKKLLVIHFCGPFMCAVSYIIVSYK